MERPLSPSLLDVWTPDTYQKCAGFAQMAGVDLDLVMLPKDIVDHDWLDQEVTFPFPEIGTGVIKKCLTHPSGYLMFDVEFQEPVPPINSWGPIDDELGGCEVVLKDNPLYHQTSHRFSGRELLGIINGDWTPYQTVNGVRMRL